MSEILKIDVNDYSLQSMTTSGGGGQPEDLSAELAAQDAALSTQQDIIDQLKIALDNKIALDLVAATSDANATANDIAQNKTAYVNGVKLIGTAEGPSPDWTQIGYSSTPQEVTNGFNYAQNIMQNWTVKSDYSYEFEEDINLVFMPLVDTSSATDMEGMFLTCYSLITIPLLDTSNVTNMSYLFDECGALQSVPLLDTSNVTDMNNMFASCYSLKTVPAFDTSSVTNMRGMFSECSALQSVPVLNYEEVTDTSSMFAGCLSLITIPNENINAQNLINTSNMFSNCKSLEIIPNSFDIPASQNCSTMFSNCVSLTTVPMFTLDAVTNMTNMFSNCPSLSNDSLNNILGMIAHATEEGYSGTHTLKWIGLSQSQANTCETLSYWSNCENLGWTTGY